MFTVKREQGEPNGEPQATSPETIGGTFRALELAQLNAAQRVPTVTDAVKPLDAMAYAVATPRDGTNTGPELNMAEPRPLKPGPIAVFISRKEGKLFVRKGFEPVFYVPITVSEPERPLGTHVFTALALNTLLAYGRDLDRFADWVAGGGLSDYLKPNLRDFGHYLADHDHGE